MEIRVRSLLAAVLRALLFCVLLVGPSLARAAVYYRRPYTPGPVPRPDLTAVEARDVVQSPYVEEDVARASGTVVIDRAHGNTVRDAELNVLQARFTARGLETVYLTSDRALSDLLRTASALVVIAPHDEFSPQEVEAAERFVEQGGRILLVADPSRYDFEPEEDEVYGEVYVTESDVTAINSLASSFGLAFSDDYLYNTQENAGNYQYIVLRDFRDSPVTAGLEQVVLYSARSLISSPVPLIVASEGTTSSLSERSTGLVAAGLGGGGRVLALGDFTVLTEPYNVTADNDRLVANVADFCAGASRTFGLAEFPYFFGDDVDLVSVQIESDSAAFSAEAIGEFASLHRAFVAAEKRLHWLDAPDERHDTFYLGLYEGLSFHPEIAEVLATSGITFTLETAERTILALTPTPTRRYTPTPVPEDASPTPTERPPWDWIHLPGTGRVDARETALFFQNGQNGREVLVVLAFGEIGLRAAAERLLWGDFTGCLFDDDRRADPEEISFALCPTAYEPPVLEPTATPEEVIELEPTPDEDEPDVLIVSDDDGEGVYEWWTSAYQFYDVVSEAGHTPLVWSTGLDGEITLDQVMAYEAVIWCTGDYQDEQGSPSEEEWLILGDYVADGGNLMLVGAFIGGQDERESGLLLDIQVAQADHPLCEGFDAGEVIVLERFTADEDYAPYVMTDTTEDAAIWTRGPESEFAGEAVISVLEDEFLGARLVVMGVPLYLLPYDQGAQLGSNAFLWLIGER